MIQGMILETFGRFKTVVGEGRKRAAELNKDEGRALAADWESLADGRILSGKNAFEKGFVDELGNFDTAVERTLKITGLTKANLISYQLPFNFSNMLRIFGKAESKGVKVDLGFDIPKALLPGRLYYVAPSFVH
jgi:protease-4